MSNKNPDVNTDTITYKGIRFNRYPDSKRQSDARYYRPHSGHIKKGIQYLHIEIWKDTHGVDRVPEKLVIHHVDGNPLNNAATNLECVTEKEHKQRHPHPGVTKEHLARWTAGQKAWRETPEGKEHMRLSGMRMAEIVKATRVKHTVICSECGKEYQTYAKHGKFCSARCRVRQYDRDGRWIVERSCAICGNLYKIKKYNKRTTCSRRCAGILADQNPSL